MEFFDKMADLAVAEPFEELVKEVAVNGLLLLFKGYSVLQVAYLLLLQFLIVAFVVQIFEFIELIPQFRYLMVNKDTNRFDIF